MERKAVYFLLFIFMFFSGALCENVIIYRYVTGTRINFICRSSDAQTDWTELEWIFRNSSHDSSNGELILRWRFKEKNGINIVSKRYKNEFDKKGLQKRIENGMFVANLTLTKAKVWHSGIYSCVFKGREKKASIAVKVHVKIHEQDFKIRPCKHRKYVHLYCTFLHLDLKPSELKFCRVDGNKENEKLKCFNETVLFNGRNTSQYYNITAKTVVPLSAIGEIRELPKDLRCYVTLENEEKINQTKTLEKQTMLKQFVHCFPYLEMENPQISKKAGQKNMTLTCIFDVPEDDRIIKIEWFRKDPWKTHLMFNWTREAGQHAGPNYKNETFTSIAPDDLYNGRTATTVTFKSATLNHTGKYTCKVTFSEYEHRYHSAAADLYIYQLEKLNFTAIGCTDQKVDLECKASKVYPKPDEISLSIYNPSSQSPVKLKRIVSSKFKNGLYDIAIKMTTATDQSGFDESPNISCDVIISGKFGKIKETNWTKRKTYVMDSEGMRTDVCKPKVEMDQTLQWLKVGQTPMFQCKFSIPLHDEIKSVVWIHRNFSHEDILYKWEKKTNNPTITGRWKNEIRDESSLIPSVIDYRRVTTLKLKNATFDYNGNYSCQVNFGLAAGHTATATLVIYDLPKRFYFKATRCEGNQTVGLECKAHNMRPKPEEVFFYVYNPSDSSWSRIDTDVYVRITERNGSFAISAKTIASSELFSNVTSKAKAKCEVILHRDIKETNVTDLAEPDTSSSSECSPNVRADKHRMWQKVGKHVVLRCTFDVPFRRHISSVEWFRQNESGALITWEASTNKVKVGKTSDMSFVMTQDHEGRNATALKIDNAKLKHSDIYICRINYGHNSSQWDTLLLVIYKIEKPYYFKTSIHGNFEDLLECKAGNIFPRPLGIVFWKYNPVTNLTAKLDNKILTEIIPVGDFFNISAEMIVEYSGSERVVYVCDVLLSEDPEILETTSIEQFGSEDISATPSPTSIGKIPTVVIIAGGVVGALLLAVGLAYLLYVCICKRLCFRDDDNKEEEEEEANAAYFGWLFNCW